MHITDGIITILTLRTSTSIPAGRCTGGSVSAGIPVGDGGIPTGGPHIMITTIPTAGDGVTMIPGILPGHIMGTMVVTTAPTTGGPTGMVTIPGTTTGSMTIIITERGTITMVSFTTGITTVTPGQRMCGMADQKVPLTWIPNTGTARKHHEAPQVLREAVMR